MYTLIPLVISLVLTKDDAVSTCPLNSVTTWQHSRLLDVLGHLVLKLGFWGEYCKERNLSYFKF